jgi:hypothetical protein
MGKVQNPSNSVYQNLSFLKIRPLLQNPLARHVRDHLRTTQYSKALLPFGIKKNELKKTIPCTTGILFSFGQSLDEVYKMKARSEATARISMKFLTEAAYQNFTSRSQ